MPVRKDGKKRTAGEGKQLSGPAYVDREWVMGLGRKRVLVMNSRHDSVSLGGRNNVTLMWDRLKDRPRVFVTRVSDESNPVAARERSSVTVEIALAYNEQGKIERTDMLMVLGVLGAEAF